MAAFVLYQPSCLPHDPTGYSANVRQLLWQVPWDACLQDCTRSGTPGQAGRKTISIHIGGRSHALPPPHDGAHLTLPPRPSSPSLPPPPPHRFAPPSPALPSGETFAPTCHISMDSSHLPTSLTSCPETPLERTEEPYRFVTALRYSHTAARGLCSGCSSHDACLTNADSTGRASHCCSSRCLGMRATRTARAPEVQAGPDGCPLAYISGPDRC